MKKIWICSLLALSACTSIPVSSPVAPETRAPSNIRTAWDRHPQAAEWNEAIRNSLLNENHTLLSADPEDVIKKCPAFAQLDEESRISFWTALTSEIAYAQKKYFYSRQDEQDSLVLFNEKDYSNPHRASINTQNVGLMDLSLGSIRYYGCSSIDTTNLSTTRADLKVGTKNLACTMNIMRTLIEKRKNCVACGENMSQGIAAYFGPLRGYVFDKRQRIKVNILDSVLSQISACQ